MEENEGMEGKDLALKEKHEFEAKVIAAIQNLKEGETTFSLEGIEVTNYGKQYTIKLKGITFGIINKEGIFTYNKENFIELKQKLEEEGIALEDLGLPDLEQSIDLEEKEKKEENEKEFDDEEKGDNEKSDEEKPDLEEEKGKKEKDEKKQDEKQKNNERENLIKLNDKTLKVLFPRIKAIWKYLSR